MARSPADASSIRLLILDVDGVLTDGRLYFGPRGEMLKAFHVRDGLGIKQLSRAGVEIAVITGRNSPAVAHRCRELGIERVVQGADDKLAVFNRMRAELDLPASTCACIGDDLPDVPVMQEVGLAFAVADAHPVARNAAHYVTSLPGGQGAVREVCDRLVASKGSVG
jgi:3-deoxy-D-manno-octulosonate 8-phosphate phosphatase (KDO 8-P phosphatase)